MSSSLPNTNAYGLGFDESSGITMEFGKVGPTMTMAVNLEAPFLITPPPTPALTPNPTATLTPLPMPNPTRAQPFWIIKLQKETTNKTMRSQSNCQIQKRLNITMIGESTEGGMHC
jgi:hypothetical protein